MYRCDLFKDKTHTMNKIDMQCHQSAIRLAEEAMLIYLAHPFLCDDKAPIDLISAAKEYVLGSGALEDLTKAQKAPFKINHPHWNNVEDPLNHKPRIIYAYNIIHSIGRPDGLQALNKAYSLANRMLTCHLQGT